MLKRFGFFVLAFFSGLATLVVAYILMWLWVLAAARRAGFQGQIGIDPVSFLSRPFGLLVTLLVFAVGFWLPIRRKLSL